MFNIAPLLRTPTYRRKTVSFERDEIIYLQGDRSDSIFYVEEGTVKLTVTSAGGKEALIGLYDGGHVFGEDCLAADGATRFHNAIAVTTLRAVKIDSHAVMRVLRSEPRVACSVVAWMVRRNGDVQEALVNQLLNSSEERLTRILSSLAQYGRTDQPGLSPRLTQQDLANMIGISRQRVNALMTRLKKSGVIDQHGGFKRGRAGRSAATAKNYQR